MRVQNYYFFLYSQQSNKIKKERATPDLLSYLSS